jgi:hypothetical protein
MCLYTDATLSLEVYDYLLSIVARRPVSSEIESLKVSIVLSGYKPCGKRTISHLENSPGDVAKLRSLATLLQPSQQAVQFLAEISETSALPLNVALAICMLAKPAALVLDVVRTVTLSCPANCLVLGLLEDVCRPLLAELAELLQETGDGDEKVRVTAFLAPLVENARFDENRIITHGNESE